MIMRMTITPEGNVNAKEVIDNDKNEIVDYDWDKIVSVKNRSDGELHFVQIANISLFQHLLERDGVYYYILHGLSKEAF